MSYFFGLSGVKCQEWKPWHLCDWNVNDVLCALLSSKTVLGTDLISVAKFSLKIQPWNYVEFVLCAF